MQELRASNPRPRFQCLRVCVLARAPNQVLLQQTRREATSRRCPLFLHLCGCGSPLCQSLEVSLTFDFDVWWGTIYVWWGTQVLKGCGRVTTRAFAPDTGFLTCNDMP